MWFLVTWLFGVILYWVTAVFYYNSKVSRSERPDIRDFGIMAVPFINILGAVIFLIYLLRLNKISFSKYFFLNFRKK